MNLKCSSVFFSTNGAVVESVGTTPLLVVPSDACYFYTTPSLKAKVNSPLMFALHSFARRTLFNAMLRHNSNLVLDHKLSSCSPCPPTTEIFVVCQDHRWCTCAVTEVSMVLFYSDSCKNSLSQSRLVLQNCPSAHVTRELPPVILRNIPSRIFLKEMYGKDLHLTWPVSVYLPGDNTIRLILFSVTSQPCTYIFQYVYTCSTLRTVLPTVGISVYQNVAFTLIIFRTYCQQQCYC